MWVPSVAGPAPHPGWVHSHPGVPCGAPPESFVSHRQGKTTEGGHMSRIWRKGSVALGVALVALGACAALASAATLVGDEGDNTLTGTPRADYILGHQGNDTLEGKGGRDLIRGG